MKITIDKAVMEQALDALVRNYSDKLYDGYGATAATSFEDDISAIKALEQPAAQPTEPAYTEAVSLATALFKKHFAHEEHYASGRIVWAPCDTTAGVISQIDNMVSRLIQPAVQQDPAGEPVAFVKSLDVPAGSFVTDLKYCSGAEHDSGEHLKYIPLYTRPAVPLTDEQIRQSVKKAVTENKLSWVGFNKDEQGRYTVPALSPSNYQLARAIEAAHKIGGAE